MEIEWKYIATDVQVPSINCAITDKGLKNQKTEQDLQQSGTSISQPCREKITRVHEVKQPLNREEDIKQQSLTWANTKILTQIINIPL